MTRRHHNRQHTASPPAPPPYPYPYMLYAICYMYGFGSCVTAVYSVISAMPHDQYCLLAATRRSSGVAPWVCLYAHARACALALACCCRRMCTYIHTALTLSLHKILFHFKFKALVRESIILILPPPHLHSLRYCNTIARPLRNIRPPSTPNGYAIHHTILVMAISCKGQAGTHIHRAAQRSARLQRHTIYIRTAYFYFIIPHYYYHNCKSCGTAIHNRTAYFIFKLLLFYIWGTPSAELKTRILFRFSRFSEYIQRNLCA